MNRLLLLAGMLMFLLTACNKNSLLSVDEVNPNFNEGLQSNGIIHHVSVGSNDALGPGEDKSFSLVANMKADGTVKGQWVDGFGGDLGGIHVSVDCLKVFGNAAILSGEITQVKEGTPPFYVVGNRASTVVVDNGTSANDPADLISYSWNADYCDSELTPDAFVNFLFEITRGQVVVR